MGKFGYKRRVKLTKQRRKAKIPNKTTVETFKKTEAGKDLSRKFNSVDELLEELKV